jgi:dihydrofolate reductase
MSKVIVGTTMSLDGFMNDSQSGLDSLYPDLEELRKAEFLQQSMQSTGAAVMGRRTFDMANGDFTDYEYQVPIFVLTHHPPAQVTKGQNDKLTITFVTEGIESAIQQARTAAGDKDVTIVGGASTAQQVINARLFDEIHIGIVPTMLGLRGGLRFFENLSIEQTELERIAILESPSRTDLQFRLRSNAKGK